MRRRVLESQWARRGGTIRNQPPIEVQAIAIVTFAVETAVDGHVELILSGSRWYELTCPTHGVTMRGYSRGGRGPVPVEVDDRIEANVSRRSGEIQRGKEFSFEALTLFAVRAAQRGDGHWQGHPVR